jgi:hypothetical protein
MSHGRWPTSGTATDALNVQPSGGLRGCHPGRSYGRMEVGPITWLPFPVRRRSLNVGATRDGSGLLGSGDSGGRGGVGDGWRWTMRGADGRGLRMMESRGKNRPRSIS